MGLTSRTGLLSSPTKKIQRYEKVETIQLGAFARPAPFLFKPFAGLYNPYPYGCSLLCNHPTDSESKEILRKAKDGWTMEGKNVLLAGEIDAIRAGIEQLDVGDDNRLAVPVESVPEELFRRYTETDSRPLTPAPTLASAQTRASGSRRCITPEPHPTHQIREKTLLILDLRRSHSQETFSWQGGSSSLEPPLIRIEKAPTTRGTSPQIGPKTPLSLVAGTPTSNRQKPKKETTEIEPNTENNEGNNENGDEFIRRRGKIRRKKRESSSGAAPFQPSIDPETQVAAIGPDSYNPSARPSLIPGDDLPKLVQQSGEQVGRKSVGGRGKWEIASFLDVEILKQLRRELNEEIVDNEFDVKRRRALEEALKTIETEKQNCAALNALQGELQVAPVNSKLWLSLPRIFTRSSARFELPMDSRDFETMTPIDYVKRHVYVTNARKLLYNCVFNKYRKDGDGRVIKGVNLEAALDLMMGRPMTHAQKEYFHGLIGWEGHDLLNFQTFCGICALCERLLAKEYCAQLPDRRIDPCHEIESADFEGLTRKLHGKQVNGSLVAILEGLKSF